MDHSACTFSRRAQQLTSSAIREILKITERPEVISFAGGLPAPVTFPVEAIQAACARTGDGLYEGLDWVVGALPK